MNPVLWPGLRLSLSAAEIDRKPKPASDLLVCRSPRRNQPIVVGAALTHELWAAEKCA